MQKPVWYWNRLKRMSPGEVTYRLRKEALKTVQRRGFNTAAKVPTPLIPQSVPNWIHTKQEINRGLYLQYADCVANGSISCFAIDDVKLGRTPVWNRDPLTGVVAPLQFGKNLDYRDDNIVGDIKYLWEINRHLQLVVLAQAYALSNEKRYLDVLRILLDSWIDQCPYLKGPNWASSLELGIRLINWSIIWQLIGGRASPLFSSSGSEKFLRRWLESIYQHVHFIQSNFSRYSSANNHLIGEAAGLYIATTTWPYWREFTKWRMTAKEILEQEALSQNTTDGVNKEQAVSYQQFVLDFLILSGLAGRANNSEFSQDYWQRIEAMLEYLASIMDVAGNVPMIGDADDGFVVNLSQEHGFCPYRSLLATGGVLFQRSDFRHKAGRLDDKTRWLLGNDTDENFDALRTGSAQLPIHRQFVEGGYYILGSDFESDDEVRVIVDAGPLGYGSLAAHGHADALTFTLSLSGREFLVDPGTYAYHTKQKWRDYFRGTSAHNTIKIDEENQSVIAGNFMWSKKAQTRCEVWESDCKTVRFVGSHDGYARLDDPVIHRRELLLNKAGAYLRVADELSCGQSHDVEQFWHFSEHCRVLVHGPEVKVTNGDITLYLNFHADDVDIDVCRGSEDPPLGWVSRRYDVKVPATTIVARYRINGATSLKSSIKWIQMSEEQNKG